MKTALKNVALFVLLTAALCAAQQTGTVSWGAADSRTVDSIDLATLTPTVNIPVLAKKGALPFDFSLRATSYCYIQIVNQTSKLVCQSPIAYKNPIGLQGATAGYHTSHLSLSCYTDSDFYVSDAQGEHAIATTYNVNTCTVGNFTAVVLDGSGYTLKVSILAQNQAPTYQVWDAAGTYSNSTMNLPFSSETDPFGNAISSSGSVITDTLGTTAVTTVTGGYQWTDTNGNTVPLTVTSGTPLTVNTGFCDAQDTGSFAPYSVNYPDGTSLSIGLEQGAGGVGTTTGRIGSITLRTGAPISYTYGTFISCGGIPVYPSSMTRTDPDGTTSYALSYNSSNGTYTDTVLDPAKNKTVYTFTGVPATPINNATTVTEIKKYQNTGTVGSPVYVLLTDDLYCYQGNTSSCATTAYTYPITQRDIYHTIGTATSRTHEAFDGYGNRTSIARYDFGVGSPTTTTTTTYGTWNGTNCVNVGNSIYNEPCDVKTVDNASHTLAESQYSYGPRGHLDFAYEWSGSTWITVRSSAGNPNGTDQYVVNSLGAQTNYTYAATGSGGCNALLPTGTSVTVNGTTLTTGATWDCNGAVVLTTTDPNSNGTSATYDAMFRPLSSTDESGQTTNFSYASNSITTSLSFSNGAYSTSTTATVDSSGRPIRSQTTDGATYDTTSSSHIFSGVNWREGSAVPCFEPSGSDCAITAYKYLDPLGRTINTVDGNGGTSTWSYLGSGTKYDTNVTIGPAPTGEHVKQAQTEVDGLGRVKSTCALETSGGTACGQAMSGSGVLTSNVYSFGAGTSTVVSTRGAQSRTTVKDALGRAISTTTPEAGTTTNYYDLPGCPNAGSSPGNLTCSIDANGINTIYLYDIASRLTDVNAIGNGNCRRYRFDTTSNGLVTPPSGTFSNLMGRLVEVATDNCTLPITPITDEWFSYDPNGRLTDVWESTPHSGGYYHTTAAYWPNSALETLSGIPGYATYSVGLNSNGVPYSSMLGTLALVNKVVHSAARQPNTVGFGAGSDQDTYLYDGNTGRMKTYTFTVGSASDAGTLTWSQNGTLQKLGIVDGFNAGGSQTCNFTYDDIARLITDNCGSTLWNQTYGYDQYDNLTKTGNPGTSWTPGYIPSPSQNRFVGGGYDADGHVTYDLNNTYTWDGYGKMTAVRSGTSQAVCGTSGTCVTYDALGRAVEKNVSGVYSEVLYSPIGRTAIMSGATTVSSAQLPMPGGSSVQFSGAGGSARNVNHVDWLGTARLKIGLASHTVQIDTAYTPYGELYDAFGSTNGNEMFTGDLQDLFTGLFDTPNRELDQTSGSRWLSPDPAGSGWNAYAYPTNPNSDTDPTGLFQYQPNSGSSCCAGPDSLESYASVGISQEYFNNGAGATNVKTSLSMSSLGAAVQSVVNSFNSLMNTVFDAPLSLGESIVDMHAGCNEHCSAMGGVSGTLADPIMFGVGGLARTAEEIGYKITISVAEDGISATGAEVATIPRTVSSPAQLSFFDNVNFYRGVGTTNPADYIAQYGKSLSWTKNITNNPFMLKPAAAKLNGGFLTVPKGAMFDNYSVAGRDWTVLTNPQQLHLDFDGWLAEPH